MNRPLRIFLASLLFAGAAQAQLTPAAAARSWLAIQPIAPAPLLEDDLAAQNFQNALVERLTATLGRPVGYKAALTNPQAQRLFAGGKPILGVLLKDMLLEDHAELPLDFAVKPAAEIDLLVRVSDPNINEAKTDLELLAGLDAVIPFIELADLALPGGSNDLRQLLAVNAGARAGVQGAPVPLAPTQATLDRLASFVARLTDEKGGLLAEGQGDALLGHPINTVRWIRNTLRARGDKLRTGDLLSLGSIGPIVAIREPGRLTARYTGLAEGELSVDCTLLDATHAE